MCTVPGSCTLLYPPTGFVQEANRGVEWRCWQRHPQSQHTSPSLAQHSGSRPEPGCTLGKEGTCLGEAEGQDVLT